jgi:hypothetical protein
MSMGDDVQRRLSRNEALYRQVNEAIERGLWPGESQEPVRFRCECSRVECNAAVEMTAGEYEVVRADARRFLVCPGHEIAGVDVVVAQHEGYAVVEKRGAAGGEAEKSDPRGA